jgi:Ala-tRNA(Pro) deacylase
MAEEQKWAEPEENEATFNKVKQYLTDGGVEFNVTEHKAVLTCEEAAEVRGAALASGAKAMLLKDSGKKLTREGVEYFFAVMSAANKFSSKQFKKTSGVKNFRFATPEEVHTVTGCLPGAVPPFGKIFGLPIWVDRSLGKNESINFNCGLRTKSITMKYEDYFKVEEPTFHVFTDEEVVLGDIPALEEKKVDNRDAKKAERLAARQKKTEADAEVKWDAKDPAAALYGEREPMRSQGDPEIRFTKKFTNICDIDEKMKGEKVIVRARLHNARGQGGLSFVVMRQTYATIQCIASAGDKVSKGMVNYIRKVPKESIIEIEAEVTIPEKAIEGCSQHNVEL